MIKSVILAGGSGTRLWPLSRDSHPKQLLSLFGDDTMLQTTIKRLANLSIKSSITICNENYRFLVAEQLRQINQLDQIILEPIGRNTAPAIALAAFSAMEEENPLLLVLPADHIIQDEQEFIKAINNAIPLAKSGKLITFGIVPNEPNTGFGYIKKGKSEGLGFIVDKFVEKPSIDLAKEFISSGEYLWNSGMFLFRADTYLNELKNYCPDIYEACKNAMSKTSKDHNFIRIDKDSFKKCPSKSIDYAVMEHTSDAIVMPMNIGWSDVGSWSALWEVSEKDHNGNVFQGDVLMHDTQNCLIRTDDRLVATIGVDNLVIISTKDSIMVAHNSATNEVQKIINTMKELDRDEWKNNREVFRPWGRYDSIERGPGYQVKLITVNPGQKLSLQKHYHRSEHWVVVSGLARVTKGDEIFLLGANQSTYIPAETIHSLENAESDIELQLIEVQSGSYLGEDDIVRYEDNYGRV